MFEVTMEHVRDFDWSTYDRYSELKALCVNKHEFKTHTRFCGSIPALISRKPCPECSSHEVIGYSGLNNPIFIHPETK